MSELITSEEATTALAEFDPQIKTIIGAANELTVVDEAGSQHAAKFLGDLKGEIKRVEDMRKDLTTGLNHTLKQINSSFKMRSEPLTKAEVIVKKKLGVYLDEQERIAREAEAKAQAEKDAAEKKARDEAAAAKKAGDKEAEEKAKAEAEAIKSQEVVVEAAPTAVRTDAGLVSSKKVWTFEIEDASKVPDSFKVVDEKAVRKAVSDGEREIPGIKIFQKTQIATR